MCKSKKIKPTTHAHGVKLWLQITFRCGCEPEPWFDSKHKLLTVCWEKKPQPAVFCQPFDARCYYDAFSHVWKSRFLIFWHCIMRCRRKRVRERLMVTGEPRQIRQRERGAEKWSEGEEKQHRLRESRWVGDNKVEGREQTDKWGIASSVRRFGGPWEFLTRVYHSLPACFILGQISMRAGD